MADLTVEQAMRALQIFENAHQSYGVIGDLLRAVAKYESSIKDLAYQEEKTKSRVQEMERKFSDKKSEVESSTRDLEANLALVRLTCADKVNTITTELKNFESTCSIERNKIRQGLDDFIEEANEQKSNINVSINEVRAEYSNLVNKLKAIKDVVMETAEKHGD